MSGELVGKSACDHNWQQFKAEARSAIFEGLRVGPLACARCGALWPGYALPLPAHRIDAAGLAGHVSWRQRVRDALDQIPEPSHAG